MKNVTRIPEVPRNCLAQFVAAGKGDDWAAAEECAEELQVCVHVYVV